MTYRSSNPKVLPPNGTIALTCMLQTRNPDALNDCTQWLHPATPLIPIDQVYTACYHLQIPQTQGNVWYEKPPNPLVGLALAVALPENYNNSWEASTLSALFFDGQYDPFVALYAMPPTSNNPTIIDPKDLEAIAGEGSFEHVPRNKYKLDLDFNRFTTAWFHRFITHRNLVNREAWMTFRNYLGFPQTNKISSVDVWTSSWNSQKASPGASMCSPRQSKLK
ncbi:hypothetical protein BC936DRAFT_146893 [Jimgerdemannia flammicorona]|uniref:Uncharacterized protein n=1 Tax=Jimgerdemannia flammicorona TaxID=994334 RepID=A0A433D6N5_9FUNG|nr:hypothetical protein BC936DRAFT_146893 [Jimgerdemannia flammicorona]